MTRLSWRTMAVAMTALVIGAGAALLGAAAPAQADPTGGNGCFRYRFLSTPGMDLTADGGSTEVGARLVQMYEFDGTNQFEWCPYTSGGDVGNLMNQRSGLCMSTDGVKEHWLTQETCDGRWGEVWVFKRGSYNGIPAVAMSNYWYGLFVDVYHDSHANRAPIDAYTWTNGLNQWMYEFDV